MRKFTFLMALVLMVSTLNAQELRSRRAINPTGTTEKSVLTRPDKSTLNNSVNLQNGKRAINFALPTKQIAQAPSRAGTILSEGFEGSFPPANWTVQNTHTAADSRWHRSTVAANTGAASAECLYTNASLMNEWLITPSLDFSAAESPTLSFYFAMSYYWGVTMAGQDLFVKISTDDGISWTQLWQEEDYGVFENFTFYNVVLDLSAYIGQSNVKIAFQYYGDDGAQANIDDVLVLDGCNNSFTTPATTSVAGNTITTTWAINNTPDSYIIEVNGEAVTTPPAATATSYTFTAPYDGPYVVKVIAVYSGCPDATSTASAVFIGIPCQWTIENMTDDYGDGWEGLVAVFQNGVNTAVLYLEDGFGPETQTFDVYSGPIEMWWIDGYFYYDFNEEDFTIYDNNGSEVFSTNGLSITINTNPPVFYTGIVNCGTPATADAAITAITAPVSGMNLTATETVTATIKNNGSDPITSMQLELKVDGTVVATETFTGNIAANATANHTFTATANLSAAGDHTIIVTAILAGDGNTANDSFTKIVNNVVCATITSLPYTEDFEIGNLGCWTITKTHTSPISNWRVVEDETSCENCGTYIAQIEYTNAQMMNERLISPAFDLSAYSGHKLTLAFDVSMSYYWHVEEQGAVFSVEASANGGTTWTEVWNQADNGEFENFEYYNRVVDISNYAGQNNVKFSFYYVGDDGAAIYLDNIVLNDDGENSIPVVNGNEINIFQSNGEINVVVSENSDIRILDMLGRVLGNYNVNSTLKVSQPAGMYLIEVRSGGAVSTHKVVVK